MQVSSRHPVDWLVRRQANIYAHILTHMSLCIELSNPLIAQSRPHGLIFLNLPCHQPSYVPPFSIDLSEAPNLPVYQVRIFHSSFEFSAQLLQLIVGCGQ